MTKYRVEFNKSGFINGAGIWETLDEICEVKAATTMCAIDIAVDALISDDSDTDWRSYAWRGRKCEDDGRWHYVKYDGEDVTDYVIR